MNRFSVLILFGTIVLAGCEQKYVTTECACETARECAQAEAYCSGDNPPPDCPGC